MTGFFKAKTANVPESTTTVEVMFAYFVAEHNLPAAIADHFSTLVPSLFLDSGIAKNFRCRRTKTTMIVKCCLTDESTDRNTDKNLAVLIRYFNPKDGKSFPIRVLGEAGK